MKSATDRYRLAILRNEMDKDHLLWIEACEHMAGRVEFDVVELFQEDWLERIRAGCYDGLLVQPTGWSTATKAILDERTAYLSGELGMPMIPTQGEIVIYEDKNALAHWLQERGVPHPETHVFEHFGMAIEFLETAVYPLVAKTSMGAGGSGVRILRTHKEAFEYVDQTFNKGGAPRNVGPKWKSRGFAMRAIRKMGHPAALIERLREYRTIKDEPQRGQVLFQAFVPHTFEWRAVRIGDSYFAHKKLVKGDKASGSLLKGYGDPPQALLDFLRDVTERNDLRSVAVDVFEAPGGGYLVNEIQCVFGQSDPYQMAIDGVPGRYRYVNEKWQFEPGDFNRYESFLLRLEYFLEVLSVRGARTTNERAGQ